MIAVPTPLRERLRLLATASDGLELLMLFGSRARGDTHAQSDWDFGYIAGLSFGAASFVARLVEILDTERVDFVDLERASGLLRFRAARDGDVIFEQRPRRAEQFMLDAADFWCDAEPV